MARATTVSRLNPKQFGKHLRTVRRRKGLSLSEVARGAGLTRRELNAYEKGKVPVPESDLFVIAGSCGVDVTELRPIEEPPALESAPEAPTPALAPQSIASIEDSVNLLRRSVAAATGAPEVPGRQRRAIDAPAEPPPAAVSDDWLVERIDPREIVQWPDDVAATRHALYPAQDPSPAEPVDVFAELARLPEPAPLPLDNGEDVDFFAPRAFVSPPPPGTVEDIDADYDEWSFDEAGDEHGEADSEPVLVDMPHGAAPADIVSAADAPPIDVAMRGESFTSPWNALGASSSEDAFGSAVTAGGRDTEVYEPPYGGQPYPDQPYTDQPYTDQPYTDQPYGEQQRDVADAWPSSDAGSWAWQQEPAPFEAPGSEPASNGFDTYQPWGDTGPFDGVQLPSPDAVATPSEPALDSPFAAPAFSDSAAGPWAHEPDPEATSTGFYVDWGEPEEPPAPPAPWEALAPPASPDAFDGLSTNGGGYGAPVDGEWAAPTRSPSGMSQWEDRVPTFERAEGAPIEGTDQPEPFPTGTVEAVPPFEPVEPVPVVAPVAPVEAVEPLAPVDDLERSEPVEAIVAVDPLPSPLEVDEPTRIEEEPPVISWRPPSAPSAPVATGAAAAATALLTDEVDGEAITDDAETPVEQFVVAGPAWDLGNALPLVEVRSSGSLVMRRADERWALADVTATGDFAVEAYVDFRSGPGFGVLFRAETDRDGRMSGYSFDIDPVYEGGSYLVREWRADRELWNPIARVPAPDPSAMHGLLVVRLTVDDDRLVASLNGRPVLTVESLKQASAERGREGAAGSRVGIQAWSSTDLVIDELRVAGH